MADEITEKLLSHCLKCGSSELEQWGESGHWWVHCHKCDHDHEDDTDVMKDPPRYDDVYFNGVKWLDENG